MSGLLAHRQSLLLSRRLPVSSPESQRRAASALPSPGRALILQCHSQLPGPPASTQSTAASKRLLKLSQSERRQTVSRRTTRPDVSVAASSFTIPEAGLALLVARTWPDPLGGELTLLKPRLSGSGNESSSNRNSLYKAFAVFRAMMFYATTLALSVPLFITMLAMTPFVLLFDRHR